MADITTIPALRAALKDALTVCVQVRFGTSEKWVSITKAQALDLIRVVPKGLTPQEAEMYSGVFATYSNRCLYLG